MSTPMHLKFICRLSSRWLCMMTVAISLSSNLRSLAADCISPPDGILAWWPGDGNGNEIVSGNNAGFENGAVTTGFGFVDGAFSFNGASAFVYVFPPPDP